MMASRAALYLEVISLSIESAVRKVRFCGNFAAAIRNHRGTESADFA